MFLAQVGKRFGSLWQLYCAVVAVHCTRPTFAWRAVGAMRRALPHDRSCVEFGSTGRIDYDAVDRNA
jgi:hypothetical protein